MPIVDGGSKEKACENVNIDNNGDASVSVTTKHEKK